MIARFQTRRRAGRQAGAAVIEYALAIALVLVVSLGSIQALQDNSEEELSDTGERVGLIDDNAYYADPSGSGTPPSTEAPPPTDPTAPEDTLVIASATASPSASDDGTKWIAFVTIVVRNGVGNPVSGVQVTGEWTLPSGGNKVVSVCTTNEDGECSPGPQRTDINDTKPEAVFTVTSMTKTNYTWTPSGADAGAVTVDCRLVAPAIC